jgi:hypothetical protein
MWISTAGGVATGPARHITPATAGMEQIIRSGQMADGKTGANIVADHPYGTETPAGTAAPVSIPGAARSASGPSTPLTVWPTPPLVIVPLEDGVRRLPDFIRSQLLVEIGPPRIRAFLNEQRAHVRTSLEAFSRQFAGQRMHDLPGWCLRLRSRQRSTRATCRRRDAADGTKPRSSECASAWPLVSVLKNGRTLWSATDPNYR